MENSIFQKLVVSLIVFIFMTSHSWAHGEDKYGPHKGFVRMPGAFHTELVVNGKNKLKVYLLDIEWKNPSIEKSKLEITYNNQFKAECKPQKDFYSCEFPKSVNLTKKGELKVIASRKDQNGAEVSYPLPLKLEIVEDGHGGHH